MIIRILSSAEIKSKHIHTLFLCASVACSTLLSLARWHIRFYSDVNQFAYIPWLNNNSSSCERTKIESDGSWYTHTNTFTQAKRHTRARRTSWSTYIPFEGRNQISEKENRRMELAKCCVVLCCTPFSCLVLTWLVFSCFIN